MKAVEAKLLTFLQQRNQFVIPIYQRAYSWELSQCQQLWRDILRVARDQSASGHFIGSVVYIAKGIYAVASLPQLLVIDGQQRLTTLTLLLAALAKVIKETGADIGITPRRLENYYLFNADEEGEARYKLLLTRNDRDTLIRLVDGKTSPEKASQRLLENHYFFEEQIGKLSTRDLEVLYEGIQKLIIVDISLDRDHDNPQLIFESLNATALKLTESDLIRNYVLMGLEPQEQARLYEDHWYPIEQGFVNSNWFDWFVRDYLTVKTGSIPNIREVYATFKAFVQSDKNERPVAEIVAEMHRYATYFVRFTQDKEPDVELKTAFADINILRVDVARPLFLQWYEDYQTGVIDRDTFLELVRMVESYVFRRAVCGIPTNSLNRTFALLYREINKSDYRNSFKAAMLLKDSYRRFPTDEEFKREIVVKDVYNFRTRNYLLAKLENHERRECVEVEGYTIEHILPQNPRLRPEWRAALGDNWKEVQSRLLHTLGNLTLTRYNSEYSDRPFAEKRDMTGGFRESPLRLNQGLGQLDTWNEAQIAARAATLAEKAARVWAAPILPDAILTTYQPTVSSEDGNDAYTLDDHAQYLQGDMRVLFDELSKRILNLDASVRMEVKKLYIAFKNVTNFVDVVPQRNRLRLSLNMRFDEIDDPKQLCRDVTDLGRWGNGDVEVGIASSDQMEDIMALVRQAFDKQMDDDMGLTDRDA